MRMTNVMIANTMLNNVNRNQHTAHRLLNRLSTQRMISRPSENPLMASRHLRFENTLSQVLQHQRNVELANSWTEVTEQAMGDVHDLLSRVEYLLQRADAAESLEQKQALAMEILELVEEKRTVMNKTFAGRHIFSGLRTDQPSFFPRDMPGLAFDDITTQFTVADLESTFKLNRGHDSQVVAGVFDFPDGIERPITNEVFRIRLAHGGEPDSVRVNLGGAFVVATDIDVHRDANGNIDWAALADDVYHDPATGEIFFRERPDATDFPLEVMYDQHTFVQGDLNPLLYFTATVANTGGNPSLIVGQTISMENQDMEFEFGVNTRMTINLLSMDVITSQMFADIHGFANDILAIRPTLQTELTSPPRSMTTEEAVEYLARERAMIETVTNDRFNNLIGRVSGYQHTVSQQQTDLGTRMTRLEMIGGRLLDDRDTFLELITNNIGADIAETASRLSTAEVALTAAMQVGMHNIQRMTLLNFL